jgi:hypothetical protein
MVLGCTAGVIPGLPGGPPPIIRDPCGSRLLAPHCWWLSRTFRSPRCRWGTHNITANENGATSNALALTVNQGATTIDLSPSSNPSPFGSLTLTATVTPSDASGTVTFNIDGTNQSTLGTLSGGVATFDASGLAIGSHSIYAVYSGDTNYIGSTSSVLTQVV